MEKYQEMKKFITAALEYSRHRADSSLSTLQRHLQILASSTDLSEFDPVSSVTTEFYVSLHELMTGLDSRSMLVWSAIAVLQKACMNASAKRALIHTYKFIPVLTRFLGTHHISDKQQRLLQILIDLTYGVKISWQEAHIPYLISTLVHIILEGEKDLKPYALGVLVNLCYKNLPALYVLMRKIEITKFIKCITKLNDNANIRMQVCKMLIILEQMKGVLPETDVLNFVDVTFNTVSTAFENKDTFLLRHIVDFFKDVKENDHFKCVMVKYSKYYGDSKKLLELVEQQETTDLITCECISMLLDFLPYVLSLQFEGMPRLLPRLAAVSLKWVHCETVSIQSLGMIQMVVELAKQHSDKQVKDDIAQQLKVGLPGLLNILDTGGEAATSIERRSRLIGLFTLLAEMSTYPDLRKEILSNVKHNIISGLLESVLNNDLNENNLFQNDVSELCIQCLSLIASLSNYNCEWMSLYTKLLNQRHVQVALAVALYSGHKKIKCQVFSLTNTPGCTQDIIDFLCNVMCEMKQITNCPVVNTPTVIQQDMVPLYNCAQESRLNELIKALQEAKEKDRIGDSSTSAIMELYEYKLAAMGHAERRMQASLEAADSCCIGMNHQIAQYRAEVTRLHQMLFYSQQCIEGLNIEKKDLIKKLQESTNQLNAQNKAYTQELKEKARATKEIQEQLKNLMDSNEQYRMLLQESNTKYEETMKTKGYLEEQLEKFKNKIGEKESKVTELKNEIKELQTSLASTTSLVNQKDDIITETNLALKDCKKRIDELERIREIVSSVVSGKKT